MKRKSAIKDSITVAGRVEAPDNGAADEHLWFSARISRALRARILTLAQAVKELKALSVTEFECSCESYNSPAGTEAGYDIVLDSGCWMGTDSGDKPEPQRCDIMELVVMKDSFRWTWLPRHADNAARCSTPEISVSDMERAFTSTLKEKG